MVGRRQNEFFFGRAKKSRCIRKCRAEQAGDLSEYLWARGSADLSVFDRHRCQDFSLVAVSKLEWNHDMVPWDIPPIFKNGASYTSGADEYLRLLINQIIPKAESLLQGTPAWRGIAGYSLAGLFALYSIYQTDAFSRVASVSGSLWFPGIKEYVVSRTPVKKPADIFFSLGDRECRTQNSLLRCVQQNTESIERYYHEQGIDTTFQLNPGNHFKDVVQRTATGLQWLLGREYAP